MFKDKMMPAARDSKNEDSNVANMSMTGTTGDSMKRIAARIIQNWCLDHTEHPAD